MPKTMLVTGGAGWIGSHVVHHLLAEGNRVVVLTRPKTDLWRLTDVLADVRIIRCDLNDQAAVANELAAVPPQVCFHLAWPASHATYLDTPENIGALQATLALATTMSRLGCERFLGTGTCLEYDSTVGLLSEDTPVGPDSLYARAKLACWLLLERLNETMPVVWARLFYQFGPMENDRRLVPMIVRALQRSEPALLTGGDQVRDFLHVADVAAALVAVSGSVAAGVVNVGSGRPITVAAVAARIAEVFGRPDLIKLGVRAYAERDPMFICAKIERLKATGWRPQLTFERGITETVEWWMAHGRAAA